MKHACPGCPDPGGRGGWGSCRCERWLSYLLVGFVLLAAFAAGGIRDAHATDFWADLLGDSCPEGQEYRGFYRVGGCDCRTSWVSSGRVWSGGQWRTCAACSDCIPGGYVRTCSHQADWPRAVCVDTPLTDDEEEDEERLGDILGNLASGGGGLGSDLFPAGGLNPLGNLFGDDLGAVQDDDLVPQVGNDDDGYECPDGTDLVTAGDDAGLCRVSDRCAFYGASGSWPACTCSRYEFGGDREGSTGAEVFSSVQTYWDSYSLRCVPREKNSGSVFAPQDFNTRDGYVWSAMCSRDFSANARGGYSVKDLVGQSRPVFVARRGGVEVLRYDTSAALTISLGASDWSLSSAEETDEEEFGNVICSWLRGPMASLEGAISGFSLGRLNAECPVISVPVFSGVASVDLHCYIVGRWLGLIQAAAIIGYAFLGVRWWLRYG